MNRAIKWIIRTLATFVIITGLSYHNDLGNDGELRFGFPKEIYRKLGRVLFADTGEIGGVEHFHLWNLVADMAFAFVVAVIIFYVRGLFGKRKNKEPE